MVPIWVLFVENAYSGVRAIAKWYGRYLSMQVYPHCLLPCLGLQSGTDAGHLGAEQRER